MAMLSRCLVGAVRRSSRTAAGQPSAAAAAPDLRTALAVKIPGFQEEVKAFRKDYGSAKVGWVVELLTTALQVGQITVDSLYGGQRMSLVTETSVLDPEEGIRCLALVVITVTLVPRFRGFTIPQCQALLPKAAGGSEPLPEGLFWLLVTGDIPTVDQVTLAVATTINITNTTSPSPPWSRWLGCRGTWRAGPSSPPTSSPSSTTCQPACRP